MPKTHKHRLLPGYAGGTYEADNVLVCTVAEHANIHKTMWLFHGHYEDYMAWKFLSKQLKRGDLAPHLEILRCQRLREALRSPIVRAKMSKTRKGRSHSEEHRNHLKAALNTPEVRTRMSAGRKGRAVSQITRARMSLARKGIIFSASQRINMSAAQKGKPWSAARRLAQENRGNHAQ